MLEILTFSGVDAQTDLQEVQRIASDYPTVEFAVLVGSQTGSDHPIFPPLDVVHRLRALHVRTAIHLCGPYARQAAAFTPLFAPLLHLCEGFDRVQVNLHKEWWNEDDVTIQADPLARFADSVAANSVIVQHRGPWDDVPLLHPKIEYLFDLSEGSGTEGFEHWPPPPPNRRAGYAGGIGPHNIQKAMDFVQQHPPAPLWLDMERNVRDQHYILDLDKVREVCRLALGPPSPSAYAGDRA